MHKVLAHPAGPGRSGSRTTAASTAPTTAGQLGAPRGQRASLASFGFALTLDPGDPDTAFVIPEEGAENRVTCDGRIGIYRTTDAGASWELHRGRGARLGGGAARGDRAGRPRPSTSARRAATSTRSGDDEVVEAARHLPPILSVEAATAA